MIASDIITDFELQTSDMTELSTVEELALLNKLYLTVCSQQPWEFLKKNAQGSISVDANGNYYIPIPSDFQYFAENRDYTNNSISNDYDASPSVIFLGPNYTPYQVVNYSDRRQYANNNGYCYLDMARGNIYFFIQPSDTAYDFDYIYIPPELALGDTPVMPPRFHKMFAPGMATQNEILQLSEKATSYAKENQDLYNSIYLNMQYWNSKLQLN